MKKRLVSMALVLAMLTAFMAGCATTAPTNDTSSGDSSQPAQESAGDSEEIVLKVLDFKVNAAEDLVALAKDYSDATPGVTVEVEVVNDFQMIRQARFAFGSAPDIFAVRGYVDFYDMKEYAENLNNEPWVSDLYDAVKPGISIDGEVYGFPMAIESYGFIYNKSLFEKAGITEEPKTVSQLKEVCGKLVAAGIKPFGEAYKDTWRFGQHLFSMPFALESDPAAFCENINTGAATIGQGKYMNGFFDAFDLTLEYGAGKDSVAIDYDANAAAFVAGDVAMFQDGIWFWNMFKDMGADFEIDMFAVPMSEDPADAKLPVDVPGYFVVNKNGNVEAAKAYLNWLHENASRYYLETLKVLPPFASVAVGDDASPLDKKTLQYSADGMTIPWSFLLWPSGTPDKFGISLQKYIDGQLTREECMTEMNQTWLDLMN